MSTIHSIRGCQSLHHHYHHRLHCRGHTFTPSPADTLNLDLLFLSLCLTYFYSTFYHLLPTLPLPYDLLPHLPPSPPQAPGPGTLDVLFLPFQPSRHIHLHHLYVLLYRNTSENPPLPPSILAPLAIPTLPTSHLTQSSREPTIHPLSIHSFLPTSFHCPVRVEPTNS